MEGLPNVTLLPWQEEDVLPHSLATGDVALVSLEKGMEGLAIPSKSVYAMAAGSALLCIASGANELRLWCDRFGCGEVVEPGDVDGLVAALERLLDDPALLATRRAAARAAAEAAFSRGTEAPRLADLVLSAVEAP